MGRWRRADPTGLQFGVTLAFLAIGCLLAAFVTIMLALGRAKWDVNPVLGSLGIYGFLALWLGFAWRMNRTGVYVGDNAVRLVYPWRTRKFSAAEISEIFVARATLGSWATARDAIWLRLRDGRLIETPIQRRIGWIDGGLRKNIGPLLGGEEFDATIRVLRQTLH